MVTFYFRTCIWWKYYQTFLPCFHRKLFWKQSWKFGRCLSCCEKLPQIFMFFNIPTFASNCSMTLWKQGNATLFFIWTQFIVNEENHTWCITVLLVSSDACSWLLIAHLVYTPTFSNWAVTLHSFISTSWVTTWNKGFSISVLAPNSVCQLLFFDAFSWTCTLHGCGWYIIIKCFKTIAGNGRFHGF